MPLPALKIVCAGERDGMLLEPLVFTISGAGGADRCVELWTNLPTLSAPAVAAVSRRAAEAAYAAIARETHRRVCPQTLEARLSTFDAVHAS